MIPENFSSSSLKELLEKMIDYRGQSVPKADCGIPLITARNVKFGFLDFTDQEFVDEDEFQSWMSRGIPKSGDILFTTEAPLGNVSMYPSKGIYAIGQRIITLRVKPDILNPVYLKNFLLSVVGQERIRIRSSGSTATGIRSSELKKVLIDFPPLLEQCRIAEMLGVWDESIDLLERLIGKTRSRKQGLMQQLLTGKKRFKEFEGSEWKKVTFEDVLLIEIGGTPSRANADCWDNEKSTLNYWLSIADLKGKYITKTKEYITELGIKKSNAKLFPAGTVVMSFKLTIGKVAILSKPMYTNEAICSLIPKHANSIDTEFLYQVIGIVDFDKEIDQAIKGKTLNKEKIKRLVLKLPSLPEQEKIAAVLSAADDEISTLEKQLAAYKQQKLGLMQQLLTGKIRVGMI